MTDLWYNTFLCKDDAMQVNMSYPDLTVVEMDKDKYYITHLEHSVCRSFSDRLTSFNGDLSCTEIFGN